MLSDTAVYVVGIDPEKNEYSRPVGSIANLAEPPANCVFVHASVPPAANVRLMVETV